MATRNDNGSIDRLTGLGGMGPIPTALATASQHTFGINNQQPLHQPQQPQQRIIGINGHPPIPFVLPPTTAISGLSPPTLATFLPGSSMTPTSTQSVLVPSVIGNPQTIQLALQPQQQRTLTGLAEPSINATGDATTDDSSNLLANATAQNQPPSPEFVCHLYAMVSDTNLCGDIISWVVPSHDETEPQGGGTKGKGKIVVHDPHRLQDEVLGRYYRHSKYSSFQRQMNYFGFKKRLHGSKKGKLSPCSYIHHGLSTEPRSLLALKRRQAASNKRKTSALGLEPDPSKRRATHETNSEADAGQDNKAQLSTCMPLDAPVMTQAVRTLPLPLNSLQAFNQAQSDSCTPQDFVQAGNTQIPLMGPLHVDPSHPALSLEAKKILEENFTNAVNRLDTSQVLERQGVPVALQAVPPCLQSITVQQHQIHNPVPLTAFGSLPPNTLLPSSIIGALPSLLNPSKPCQPAQISTQAYTEVSSSASGRSLSSDSPSSGADSTGIRTPPGLYAQQPALSAAGIPMNLAAALGGIQSQQNKFNDLTTTLLSTALPPSDELFRDDDLSSSLFDGAIGIQPSSSGGNPLPGS